MRGVAVQIDGYDPVEGKAVTLRAASHDLPDICALDNKTWWPAIAMLPKLRYDLFDGSFAGQIAAPAASMSLSTEPWPLFARYGLADAQVSLWTGEIGQPWSAWTLRLQGRSTARPQVKDGRAELSLAVDDRWLDTALLASYAGTTKAEGPAALKGMPKPLALGAPRYVPGTLIDSVNSVFQVSGYGPIRQIEAALEKAIRYGAPIADYPNYDALVAATIPRGTWATALAVGMARFGAPPEGKVSFLLQGDQAGPDGWARLPGRIIRRLALLAGGAGRIDDASLNALDAARPYPQSIYLDEQTTARELIQRIAASVNAVAGVSWTGKLFVLPVELRAPTLTLAADGSALPPIGRVDQLEIDAPWKRLAVQSERTWAVHDLSEVAFTAPLIDRGRFDPAETYREGNIVDLADGSRWLFTGLTPAKGEMPRDGSPVWSSMAPPTAAADIKYGDGETLEAMKPAEPAATNSADPDSPFGPDGTVGDAKQKLADMDAAIGRVLEEIEGAEGPTQAAIAARDAAQLAATNSATARDDSRAARDAAQTANEEALASAKTAAGSAGTAEAQAKIATTKADDAGEQATIAKGQATLAVTSAGEASTSASNAATSEKNASGSATSASTQAGLSATSAKDAASSATAASGSAGTASTKADQAGTSASAADSSRTAAQTAAGDAATYRDQASTSASGAAGSASTASTQAGLSAGSARDAANSATAANTSASTASTRADAAGVSANAASVSAQEAKGYRDGAASSATSASGSAVAADGSRASALTYAQQAASSNEKAGGSASAASQSASAADASAASAKSSADLIAVVGGNLLSNSDFASGTAGWSLVSNSPADFVWGVDNAGFTIPGDHYQGLLCTKQNGDLSGAIVSDWVAIRPGDWVQISAWLAARESHSKLRLQWAGGGGAYLRDGPESDVVTPPTTGWENLDGWARVWCKAEAPSDARFARLVLAKGPYLANPNGFLSWAFMLRPMLALATASQVAPSPYQPASGGAGVQALSAKVSTVEGASVNALTRTSAAIFRKTVQAGNGQAGITIFALDENGVAQSGVMLEGNVSVRGNLLVDGSIITSKLGANSVSSTRGLAGMGGNGITSDIYGETPRLRIVSSGGQTKIDVQSDGTRASGSGLMTAQLWAADTRGEFALSREVAFSPSNTAVPVAFWSLTDFAAGSTVDLFVRFFVKSSNTSWSFSSAGIVATELKR